MGLRSVHIPHVLKNKPEIGWFELLFDNFRLYGGKSHDLISEVSAHYPLTLHAVGMNLGSCDPIDFDYLQELKTLGQYSQATWISDHLCWTAQGGHYYHDLLPLPFNQESLSHLVNKITKIQDFLGEKILIENISSYCEFTHSEMDEAEFLAQLSRQADCLILLDINNIYVNAYNHDMNGIEYLHKIPKDRVQQYHLGGHDRYEDYLIDSHGQTICKDVWQLFADALHIIGPRPVAIERDTNIPSFTELHQEVQHAQEYYQALV